MGVINNSANIQGKVNGGSIVGGGIGAPSVIRGKSAYEVALAEGFVGTEQEWLDSLKGEEGVSITRAEINHDGELILYFSDESHINVGRVVGEGEVIEGISPEISVSAIDGGNRVTIKDVGGTKYVDIYNGAPGADGYSPIVTVSKSGKVTTITIIDKNGKKTATIIDGADGDDGFSPLVSVTEINGGHRVSVTDKDGQKSFDVMDGADGEDSEGGGTYFAVCSTAAGTAEKAVSVEGFELKVGASVTVKFNSTNSVVSPTLNVSNTGAYPIIYKGAAISAYPAFGVGSLEASKVYDFVFTGANYELVGGLHIDRPAGEKLGYAKSGGDITFDGGVGTVNRSDKAVSDEDGSNIKTTYAKKAEIPSVPVKSVNGKTGAVTLDADDVGARPDSWTPTYSEVGADKSGAASSAVSSHNTNNVAHNDIRLLIEGLSTRLNALANSTDTDLDQMAELVAYIKNNKSLIDGITTNKVNVADIINNLTTNASNKPLSAAQGVALKALIDAITVPTKLSQLATDASHRLVTDTEKAAWNNKSDFSGAYSDLSGKPTIPTVPTKVSAFENDKGYLTAVPSEYVTETELASELAKRGQLKPEYANSIEECTDTSKLYVLPDGYIYAYMLTEVEAGPSYTNVLPLAINADGTPYVGNNGEKGYKTGYRLNSSRAEVQAANRCCTGFIPIKYNDTVRLKNIKNPIDGNINGYFHFYGSNFTDKTGMMYEPTGVLDGSEYIIVPSQLSSAEGYESGTNATNKTAYMRISTGVINDTSIITINEEITEGGGTTTGYAWANTGHAFVPADYEDRIVELENDVSQNTKDIANLKKGITTSTPIKDWDSPIYDANIPVFELSTEKAAMTNATNTPANIYAKYDALMARHPKYITKTDLGLCSDGVNHVYRYDFREPEPLHESNKEWSETKAKAIIVTGIHFEWAGIYAMYNALEEIADNPELRNFRRNTHLIVVPCCNPYATIADNYQSGLSTPNSYGVRNANGVEIHRNFEVDWVLTAEGTTHYGGARPLSEVETQYIDNIMKNNTDAALFLSCHNCGVDTFWGTGFIWASTATKYMSNMGYRVIDKLSDTWMSKYGDTLSAGIAEYKTDLLENGETRLGWTGLSSTAGTEAKQATKYGIQGTNVEICEPFQIHGTKANPEPSMSSFTMSRGAEVYVNFLLTAFGVYDPKDKKDYAPNLPWED